jgi:hypothetical protein
MAGQVLRKGIAIKRTCWLFSISETCYRYRAKLSDENGRIAEWLLRLACTHRTWQSENWWKAKKKPRAKPTKNQGETLSPRPAKADPSPTQPRSNKINKQDTVTQDVTKHVNQTVNTGPIRRGAPSRKTPELIDRILAGIADGRSTRAMCNEVGIGQRTVWDWLASDREFSQQYARAKMFCADCLADEIIEIADDCSRDTYIDRKGQRVIDHKAIARAKLRIDARKWLAAKLASKKYGNG